jgi:hypothetical protein
MDSQNAALGSPSASSIPALVGINVPPDDGTPHPKWEWATSRIHQRRELCDRRALAHDAKAVVWQQWAAPLTWFTAVLAALSALCVVASMSLLATILSIVTALFAATVAAFQPSEAAKTHRAAATAYDRLARKLDDVEALDLGDRKQQIPAEKIDAVRAELVMLEDELNAIELSHPPISGFGHRVEESTVFGQLPVANLKPRLGAR